ncbi:hypothetical protein KKJ04_06660 [Xenorhabdus bovienii]|uniref:Tc toxin subunit A-related protein n=1 Tax=Xenorhabdus bovienii TaxID=40576 RepID=UPI0023B214AA|nr:neuraminidase-like domain-containing protein [Xenorhabdus bovienii]MDE9445290.1 hypothetical protein [Xenorhabdus bovienii]
MSETFINTLEESYRDGLLAYCLGQVFPHTGSLQKFNINTVEELYDYLLIDPLMNADAKTTVIAHRISSLLQLNHAIYNNMEPGYTNGFDKKELNQWQYIDSDMSVWGANKLLLNYAENYIDPELRLNKTTAFADFLSEIKQNRISTQSVQRSVQNYLSKLERICNISTIAGYLYGNTVIDAKLVFLGQSRLQPDHFYWRVAENIIQDVDGKASLSPTAWNEWQEIQLSTGEIINPKIIWINNRVHIVYFTKKLEQAADSSDPSETTFTYQLEIIYQKLNNSWSTPIVLAIYPNWPTDKLKLTALVLFGRKNTEGKNGSFDVMYELDDRPNRYVRKVLTLDSRLQCIKAEDILEPPAGGNVRAIYAKFFKSKINVCDSAYYYAKDSTFPNIIQENGGEYLALQDQKLPDLTHIRLNTTFAAQLVARASLSLDNLFSWEAQNTLEVAPPSNAVGVPNTLDFHGANGLYFWEIFFHIPHAVANRLHQEFSYRDAENWYHYLFNPQIRVHEGEDNANKTPYWRVCPLLEPGSYAWEQEAGRVADPDAICYSTPERYKKAIFMEYARNILAQGDALYRRLTRDALTEARIHYSRVTALLGPRPDVLVASRWTPKTLEALSTDATVLDGSLARFLPEMLPEVSKVRNEHWKVLDDPKVFRTPVNPDLIALWDTLQQRLDTLHNNLTIDGKPMLLEMYAAPVNPRDLLRAQSSASGLSQRAVSALAPILPYRFGALLPRVQSAVETLTRFGDLVRQYREQKEQALQEERVQSQMDELSAFAVQLQEVALEQQQAAIDTLISSKKVVTERQAYYRKLKDNDISSAERDSMDKRKETIPYEQASAGMESAASIADLVPNLFGTSVGGSVWGGPARALGWVQRISASEKRVMSYVTSESEQYRRRREEWHFQHDQAAAEGEMLDEQIKSAQNAKRMVQVQLDQARKEQEQAKVRYQLLLTRTTGSALYQWLISQMSTFYFQAYDAVTSLCLSVEACWRYEMGDYEARFIQPNVWFDNYFGLTAGEALKLQLLNMESTYLKRHDRRLEIVKTVSLKQWVENSIDSLTWDEVVEKIRETGQFDFSLSPLDFDRDYPGHYLRQIVNISINMPLLLGPYEEIKATLTQTSSETLLSPDMAALKYYYPEQGGDIPIKPASILSNPRVSQSIVISNQENKTGVLYANINDERYLPFEGTGAISSWRLDFPRADKLQQSRLINALKDIVIEFRYTAQTGNTAFTHEVSGLVRENNKHFRQQ